MTCFNAANQKRVTTMMAGRIALFKMRNDWCMKRVSTMVVQLSLASVTKAANFALLDIQMTDTASCLAAVKNK